VRVRSEEGEEQTQRVWIWASTDNLKVAALEKYASQHHRRYANAEYVRNLARMHGVNVNREYAEVFQVYRVVA